MASVGFLKDARLTRPRADALSLLNASTYGELRCPRGGSLQSGHILILTTSSDQYGARHLMQTRQPTRRTMRGGMWSVSSTASRRLPPSHAHGSGSSKPVSKRPPLRRGVAGGTGPVWVSLPLSPWLGAARGCASGCAGRWGGASPRRHATSHAGSVTAARSAIRGSPPNSVGSEAPRRFRSRPACRWGHGGVNGKNA